MQLAAKTFLAKYYKKFHQPGFIVGHELGQLNPEELGPLCGQQDPQDGDALVDEVLIRGGVDHQRNFAPA